MCTRVWVVYVCVECCEKVLNNEANEKAKRKKFS